MRLITQPLIRNTLNDATHHLCCININALRKHYLAIDTLSESFDLLPFKTFEFTPCLQLR